MKLWTFLLLVVVALGLRVLASMVAPLLGQVFDPLLIVAVLGALAGRPVFAMFGGILTGALEDAWAGDWLGCNAFTHLTAAFVVSLVGRRVDITQRAGAAGSFAAATLVDWGLQVALVAFFNRSAGTLPTPPVWGLAVVVNTLAGLLIRRFVFGRRERTRRRR